jgi:hypothetical protein
MRALRLVVAAALAATTFVVGASSATAQSTDPATVYILHGIKGVDVDVYVNGSLRLPNFRARDIAGPLTLAPGNYRIQVFPDIVNQPTTAPSTGALIDQTLAVPAGGNLSIVAHARTGGAAPTLTAFADDITANGPTGTRVSVRHAANAPAVDVIVNGSPALTNLTNGNKADANFGPVSIQAAIAATGTTTPLFGPVALNLGAATLTNAYAIAAADGSGLELITHVIGLGIPPETPTSSVTIVHGILELSVDVYVDGVLTLANFEPRSISQTLQLAQGRYRVQVFPRAANPPATAPSSGAAIDGEINVPLDGDVTAVAHVNAAGTPALVTFPNDTTAITPGNTRVTVRHAAKAGPVDVVLNGAAAVEDLPNGEQRTLTVPAISGATVAVAAPNTTTPIVPELGLSSFASAAGVLTNVYAVSNVAGTAFGLVAQTVPLDGGVRLVSADGRNAALGNAATVTAAAQPTAVVRAASTPDGRGYYTVTANGIVSAYGTVQTIAGLPSTPQTLNKPIVDIAVTPSGRGVYLAASDGGVFAYGDAEFKGSAGSLPLNQPIVGMALDPDESGYWLVATDGGVFSYDAPFWGSTGSLRLNQPINDLAPGPGGQGYWMVASDGGVFSFGNARFYGSAGSTTLAAPIVGIQAASAGRGYRLIGADGGIISYGTIGALTLPGGSTIGPIVAGV